MRRTCYRWGGLLLVALLSGGIARAEERSIWSRLWPLGRGVSSKAASEAKASRAEPSGKASDAQRQAQRSHRRVSWSAPITSGEATAGHRRGQSPLARVTAPPKRWWNAIRRRFAATGRKTVRTSGSPARRRRSGLFAKKEPTKPPRTTKEFFALERPEP